MTETLADLQERVDTTKDNYFSARETEKYIKEHFGVLCAASVFLLAITALAFAPTFVPYAIFAGVGIVGVSLIVAHLHTKYLDTHYTNARTALLDAQYGLAH